MSGATYALPDGAPCPVCSSRLTGMMLTSFCKACDSKPKYVAGAATNHATRGWSNGNITFELRADTAVMTRAGFGVVVTYRGGDSASLRVLARETGWREIEKTTTPTQRCEAYRSWNECCNDARQVYRAAEAIRSLHCP